MGGGGLMGTGVLGGETGRIWGKPAATCLCLTVPVLPDHRHWRLLAENFNFGCLQERVTIPP